MPDAIAGTFYPGWFAAVAFFSLLQPWLFGPAIAIGLLLRRRSLLLVAATALTIVLILTLYRSSPAEHPAMALAYAPAVALCAGIAFYVRRLLSA
jgi:hypothetical protein